MPSLQYLYASITLPHPPPLQVFSETKFNFNHKIYSRKQFIGYHSRRLRPNEQNVTFVPLLLVIFSSPCLNVCLSSSIEMNPVLLMAHGTSERVLSPSYSLILIFFLI